MRACWEMQSSLLSGFVAAIYGMTVCPEAADNALSTIIPRAGLDVRGSDLFERYAGSSGPPRAGQVAARPRRSARPASTPVCWPWSMTTWPLTIT